MFLRSFSNKDRKLKFDYMKLLLFSKNERYVDEYL